MALRYSESCIEIVSKGFINNMAEYMASCDCIITKAGPGTIAEALACGLPIVLNGANLFERLFASKCVTHRLYTMSGRG